METDFWLQRWQLGQTGWHQAQPHFALERHWAALRLPRTARVFVPLAGKSLDLLWLAQRGHAVVGCELSALAVRDFYAERQLVPQVEACGAVQRYRAGAFEMLCGDLFALAGELLGAVDAVFDRAALVALPAPMRERYVSQLAQLGGTRAQTLLVTTEYEGATLSGPPFAVGEAQVRALYEATHTVELLERCTALADAERFRARGASGFAEAVYRLTPRGADGSSPREPTAMRSA
jgi:thiopurine S-methyltransferase